MTSRPDRSVGWRADEERDPLGCDLRRLDGVDPIGDALHVFDEMAFVKFAKNYRKEIVAVAEVLIDECNRTICAGSDIGDAQPDDSVPFDFPEGAFADPISSALG